MTINWAEIDLAFIKFAQQFVAAILIFVVAWILSRILRGIVIRFARRRKLPVDITNLILQISMVTILLFGVVTALGTMGIDMGGLIAGLGLIGFGIGYALKDLVSNFIAGLLILLYNPFIRGDIINVSGSEGVVTEVNMRYTILTDGQGKKILIPNSSLFTNVVIVEKKTL